MSATFEVVKTKLKSWKTEDIATFYRGFRAMQGFYVCSDVILLRAREVFINFLESFTGIGFSYFPAIPFGVS